MEEDLKILFDRREQIKAEIKKLSKEYDAIGSVLIELHRYKKAEKEKNIER